MTKRELVFVLGIRTLSPYRLRRFLHWLHGRRLWYIVLPDGGQRLL